ncbi:MAG: hypothetical protein HS113_08955 [Verrucomicrobiales bacterium]|nr:hypothetical protein [Verrucomicrobiales bacterium]
MRAIFWFLPRNASLFAGVGSWPGRAPRKCLAPGAPLRILPGADGPFLFELLRWARPYRTRLGLGIAFGVVAGLNEVLLVLAIYFVFAVIFPQTGAQEIQAALERLAVFLPGVARFLGDRVQELSLAPTVPTVVLVVSVIPAVMSCAARSAT